MSVGRIIVNNSQRGNPVLEFIENVKWEFLSPSVSSSSCADYVLGKATGALFLSLKYHLLHPDYLYARMREGTLRHFHLLCGSLMFSEKGLRVAIGSLCS